MTRPLVAALALAPLLAGGAVLAAGASPPVGWEQPPAPSASTRVTTMPACCAGDTPCCERQILIDARREPPPSTTLTLVASDLPEATVKRSPAPGPGIEGAPALRIMDGRGQPPPWKDGPFQELRVAPPGKLGDIARGDGFFEPFFEAPALRSQGYGIVHGVSGRVAPFSAGPYRFHALAPGPNGTVSYDYVEGELDLALHTVVRTWVHADAKHVAQDALFAFRSSDDDGERVHLVLPEVLLDTVSAGVALQGGFEPGSRFSRSWSFTEYTMRAGPGAGERATFSLVDTEIRTMRELGVAPASLAGFACSVDVSRTSTEPSARIRVHLFPEP